MVTHKDGVSGPAEKLQTRASVACQQCRIRKVKCDVQSFESGKACSPCRRGGNECVISSGSDGRRSVSRKQVNELQQRIRTLESLAHHEQDGDRHNPTRPPPRLSPTTPSIHYASQSPPFNTRRLSQAIQQHTCTLTPPDEQPLPYNSGTIRGKNHQNLPAFFGTTSHPHVGTPVDQSSSATSANQSDTIDIGVGTASSPQLKTHLIHSFFNYQTLFVDVVNKEVFLAHRNRRVSSEWYCDFLEYAMLACATRLATSSAVRALGREYSQLAKSEILSALEEPTPACLQALLLLSEYEASHGNDRIGWMYCGIACRMVSDLGLHEIELPENIHNNRRDDMIRKTNSNYALLAACIVYEGVWTLYLGRPTSIPHSIMDIAALRCKANLSSDSSLLNAWLGLCVPMAEVSHILNDRSSANSSAHSALSRLTSQVQDWYDNLGPELTYDENRLPHLEMAAYGLHTQYCKVQILLKKALDRSPTAQKRKFWQVSEDPLHHVTSEEADRAVYQYSLRIARLVVTYREVFGVDKIPSIMLDNAIVAATSLIKYVNHKSNANIVQQRDIDWIRLLIKTLEALQPHFPITRRMLDTLRFANESTPANLPISNLSSRPDSNTESLESNRSRVPDITAFNGFNQEFDKAAATSTAMEGQDVNLWSGMVEGSGSSLWKGIDEMFSDVPFTMPLPDVAHSITYNPSHLEIPSSSKIVD